MENPELSVNELKQFMFNFVEKLQIFDPMDRAIPQKKNQAMKRDEL